MTRIISVHYLHSESKIKLICLSAGWDSWKRLLSLVLMYINSTAGFSGHGKQEAQRCLRRIKNDVFDNGTSSAYCRIVVRSLEDVRV
jgi:hypothetical protein